MAKDYTPGVEVSEYKGHPVLELPLDNSGRYSFRFGLSKAKAILAHVEDIKRFVEEYDDEESSS